MLRYWLTQVLLISVPFCGIVGCGAPTKSPEEVAHIFNPGGQNKDLSSRLNDICGTLSQRQAEPSIRGKFLRPSNCNDAGEIAQDLSSLKQFYFQGFDSSNLKAEGDDEVLEITTRSQVWLNSSIIDMASSLGSVLGNKDGDTGLLDFGGDDEGGISKLADAKIKFLEPFAFNKDDFSFNALLNLKLTGAVIADHDIAISGKLIDNVIAVTVKTTKDRVYDESVLKSADAVILVIPYAQDIYVDFFLDLKINSIGFDGLVKGQVESILSTSIKKFVDGIKSLGN